MSRFISLCAVLVLAVATVSGRGDRFPTCLELLEFFGEDGVNLFTNAEKVSNIRSNECAAEDGRLMRVYFCSRGIEFVDKDALFEKDSGSGKDSPFGTIQLPFTEVHDLSAIVDDVKSVLCYNPRSVSVPAGEIPPATLSCSKTSGPTRRVQYATDEKNICFTSCSFGTASNGVFTGQRTRTVTQCCSGYKPNNVRSSRFSFLNRAITCAKDS